MVKGNTLLKKLFLSIYLSSCCTVALGDVCVDALRDRQMAVETKNYELMILTADTVITRCDHRSGRGYGRVVADKVVANTMLGRHKEGLKSAASCLKNYPGFPTCLYWKAVIHKNLSQKVEFERTRELAIQASDYLIENESRLLVTAISNTERISLQADIDVARVIRQRLSELAYR